MVPGSMPIRLQHPAIPDTRPATASILPRWLSATLVAGTFLALAVLERRRPLRRSVEPGLQRTGRNLAIAAVGATAVHMAETPIVARAQPAGDESLVKGLRHFQHPRSAGPATRSRYSGSGAPLFASS